MSKRDELTWLAWPFTVGVDYDPLGEGDSLAIIERAYRGLQVNPAGHATTGKPGVPWRVEVKARTLADARAVARRLRRLKDARIELWRGNGRTTMMLPLRAPRAA